MQLRSIFSALKPPLLDRMPPPIVHSVAFVAMITSGIAIAISPGIAQAATVYTGILEPGDAIFAYDGSLYDDYAIQGEMGEKLTIQLQSDEFDPFVAIVGPQGEWLLQNDDVSGTNNNSELSFIFPDDNVYFVFVNTYAVSGRGTYTLSLSVNRGGSQGTEVVVPPGAISMPPPRIINTEGAAVVDPIGGVTDFVGTAQTSGLPADESNDMGFTLADQQALLSAHNQYRTAVAVPELVWSATLAASAQQWANHLAATNTFSHSSSNYGENLWAGTAGDFSLTEMVSGWGDEQQYFIPNAVFPNVSTTGNWADVGHYTQLVWRDTTEVGCAIATGNGRDTLVCQYNPPGNYQGDVPY